MADAEVSTPAPETPSLPSELPVVPLRDTVVLPMTVAPLGVGRPVSIEAINRALAGDRMVLATLRSHARQRQRFWLGLPLFALGIAGVIALARVGKR